MCPPSIRLFWRRSLDRRDRFEILDLDFDFGGCVFFFFMTCDASFYVYGVWDGGIVIGMGNPMEHIGRMDFLVSELSRCRAFDQ